MGQRDGATAWRRRALLSLPMPCRIGPPATTGGVPSPPKSTRDCLHTATAVPVPGGGPFVPLPGGRAAPPTRVRRPLPAVRLLAEGKTARTGGRRRGRCAAAPTQWGSPLSPSMAKTVPRGRGVWHTPGRDAEGTRARAGAPTAGVPRSTPRAGPAAGGRPADAPPHVGGRVRHERRRGAGPQRTPWTILFAGGCGRPRSRPSSNGGAYVAGARARIRARHSGGAVSPFFYSGGGSAGAGIQRASRERRGRACASLPRYVL